MRNYPKKSASADFFVAVSRKTLAKAKQNGYICEMTIAEVLLGDKQGIESVRVNDQYRIEFNSSVVAGEEILTICNILDLSNHYK